MEEYSLNTLKEPDRYVVIPAYQPSNQLVQLVYDVTGVGYEVLIVDDGSDTKFAPVWNALKDKATIIHHSGNQGKGAALKTAFQYLSDFVPSAGLIVTMDADGQHLPKDMEAVIETSAVNPHSLVLGGRQFDKTVPARSRFGNRITRAVFSAISKARVSDTQTGLRAFDRSLLGLMLEIPGERYEYEMNMLLQSGRQGIPILEVPIQTVYLDRQNSISHFDSVKDSVRIYKTIIKFISSSLLSFAIDYVAFLFLVLLTSPIPYHLIISNVGARIVSATVNYTLNKNAVFRGKKNVVQTLPQYALLAFGILCANSAILSFFAGVGLTPHFAKLLTELVLFIISFSVQSLIIFKPKDSASQVRKDVHV
jgi:glycosyltransferase involved in cell wall biosynthesis